MFSFTLLPGLPSSFVRSERTCSLVEFAIANGVTRLSDLTGLDSMNVPVWSATRPDAYIWQVSAGKGINNRAAITSTLMESIETICMETKLRFPANISYSTCHQLRIDPNLVELESEKICGSPKSFYPEQSRYLDAIEMKSNTVVSVPEHWAYLGEAAYEYGVVTNGLACGYSDKMATMHALKEILERHLLSDCCSNGVFSLDSLTKLDLSTSSHLTCYRLKNLSSNFSAFSFLKQIKSSYLVWLVIIDSNPPSCKLQINFGSCFDFSLNSALNKSFFEVCQQRLSQIQGTREDLKDITVFDGWKSITKVSQVISRYPVGINDVLHCKSTQNLDISYILSLIPGNVYKYSYQIPTCNLYCVKIIAPEAKFSRQLF
jgi:YcaO-like protein with predicted kinase domain